MIRQKKDSNVPKSLSTTKSYRRDDVQRQLMEDQHEKCYICEQTLTTDFEIEHLKSQSNHKELTQEWNNLFMSCGYCNRKKSSDYDEIVNPLTIDVEDVIKQEFDFPNNKAKFTSLTTADTSVEKTIELLNVIYNGTKKCRKFREEQFIKEIRNIVSSFCKMTSDYLDNPNEENREAIIADLSIDQEALGFKYWIIKSKPELEKTFANYIVWNKTKG